ncbi:coenzyme Q-binding protein COQ10 homolog, mitochondrial-like [Punica granatum]|uniref:Coenzyme Q-binding protein COQ10 homolog, mitochondrial-like n=2 Tax=Punica granatum TaxID=22663 RepID=A0A6P8EBB6_PUNGR|nr:coenzyme Q-binding protein COQ10 homolog, mitochondrial-like [Punica granatum]XP_031407307.1 coenzyme Q-binding protein COQ10 homolog, mitochondrial-like [Punica granatum]OWM80724.1 hypothetical protein CDL15_Pgr006754 [Punica granatum]PKI50635.1 hypothetical protein CRG98_028947 [Punica granatum]
MPPFSAAPKALGSLLWRRTSIGRLVRRHASSDPISNCDRFRCLGCSGVAGIGNSFGGKQPGRHKEAGLLTGSLWSVNNGQRRRFLGCGDGEEGSVLSKVYEERRVLGYSPTQLFDVVAAVDFYQDFLPWCQRSEILRNYPDGSLDAELEIGFKFLVESYVSHVEMKRPTFIKSTASDSTLFEHLINVWEFNPGPVPGSCDLHFLVDFKFQSPLYSQVASMFFKEVVARLVGSFNERCHSIYGPEVRILEEPHRQRA